MNELPIKNVTDLCRFNLEYADPSLIFNYCSESRNRFFKYNRTNSTLIF